jgi:L-ascorbate metabolism protein UlaG (beta-lactamase superfamily)
VNVTHFGHACLLVEIGAARILLDPGTLSSGFEGLRNLTAVLITHEHDDHLDVGRIDQLMEANPGAALLVDSGSAPKVAHLPARVLAAGDRVEVSGAAIEAFGGRHAFVYADVPSTPNIGYLIDDAFFSGGDSYLPPGRPVDVLAVPISGPWTKLGESIEYARQIGPRVVIPMHEAALADTEQAHGMLRAFLPETTRVAILERGVATTL